MFTTRPYSGNGELLNKIIIINKNDNVKRLANARSTFHINLYSNIIIVMQDARKKSYDGNIG